MPSGFTDRDTINERRELSPYMSSMLRALARGPVQRKGLSTAEKNALRGLLDRGYADCQDGETFTITADGAARERTR